MPSLCPPLLGLLALSWLCLASEITKPDRLEARQTTSEPCGHEATCTVSGDVGRYHWRQIRASGTFTAFTIVTVINTVSNTTRTSTVLADTPGNFQPPQTNSEGKRIQTLTYNANGKTTSTVVTFPTLFFDWPNQYAVSGEYVLTTNGKPSCVNFGTTASTVVPISGDPQPGPPRNTESIFDMGADVLGWGYTLEYNGQQGAADLVALIDLLPDNSGLPHSVVKSCLVTVYSPANNKFDGAWLAVGASSVSYVGDDDHVTSTTAGPQRSPGPTTKGVVSDASPKVTGAPGSPATGSSSSGGSGSEPGSGSGSSSDSGPQTSAIKTSDGHRLFWRSGAVSLSFLLIPLLIW
ncbi:hypothetical protein QBC47DRAFT_88805 [Echria macrotheca]|uniref:Uncharacterized protein n=1 Tax=Echria macrotheca TaxID=438768 RepID=A0AAJ0F510_9PEZI|nr:hypothetical protein QBC47DRAFT_88805 [Echria macrotheca]